MAKMMMMTAATLISVVRPLTRGSLTSVPAALPSVPTRAEMTQAGRLPA